MAKPGTAPKAWATGTNYTVGPRIGTPTKAIYTSTEETDGWRPDQKPPAQWQNFWQNEVYQWLLWVNDGSSAADADAHIVETTSTGFVQLVGGFFGPPASGVSVTVTGNSGSAASEFQGGAGQVAGDFTGGTGASGITSTGNGSGAGIAGTGGATGVGVSGIGFGGQPAILGVAATSGAGGNFTGGPTGPGVLAVGGATSGKGGDFTAGTGSGANGVEGGGDGAGYGGNFTGGATGSGLLGTGGSTSGNGVEGTGTGSGDGGVFTGGATDGDGVVAAGTGNGDGVTASGAGTGAGVRAIGANGYGVIAQSDTTSPQKSALRLVPQDADPSVSPQTGDTLYNSTTNEIRWRDNVGWKTIPKFTGFAADYQTAASFNLTATAYEPSGVILSSTITTARSGFVYVWVSWVGDPAGNNNPDFRLRRTTGTATTFWEDTSLQYTAADVLPSGFVTRVAVDSGSNDIEFQGKVSGSQFDLAEIRMVILGMW
jgi:hypothetical protein